MVPSGANVIIRDEMLSSGMKCYHLLWNVVIWDEMLSSGMKCYHLGWNVIICVAMLSSGLQLAMLSSGVNVIIWGERLSSGANIMRMLSSGASVIIWCYHVMLSSGMITFPFFIFPENFTHSSCHLDGTLFFVVLHLKLSRGCLFFTVQQRLTSPEILHRGKLQE